MLEFAARAGYDPGTNLRGEQAQTGWLFLLSRLDLGCAVVVGVPEVGTLLALAAVAADVLVDCSSSGQCERARRTAAGRMLGNVRAVRHEREEPRWPDADLVYVTARELPRIVRSARALGVLDARLAAGAAVYLEPSPRTIGAAERLGARVAVVMGAPGSRERRSAPEGHRAAWLLPADPNGRPGPAARALRLARRAAARRRTPASAATLGVARVTGTPISAAAAGPAAVLARTLTAPPDEAPDYLIAAGRAAGHALDGRAWQLAAPRGYRSQKVIFFIGDGEVVKLTQDPRFNPRLDNEFDALRRLRDRGLDAVVDAPRALFRGEHARLSIVGETRLEGEPFRERSTATPDCPTAAAAIAAIADLGAASAAPAGDLPVLAELLARYRELYRPGSAQERMLEAAVAALVDAGPELPSVFLHGDPTTLNLLVAHDGRVGMVDWENAEPAGPPLWDLLYFLQTYAGWATVTRGQRPTPAGLRRDLLDPDGFGGLPVRAVESYRRRLELAPAHVRPLFCTCWMYLALRQARQLASGSLGRGLYTRLLEELAREDRRWPW